MKALKDGTHGTHQDSEEGPYLLSAKNIKNGQVIIDDTSDRKISKEEFDQIHTNFKLELGDVLLTIVGSIGETAILENIGNYTFQRSVAFLRPRDNLVSRFLKTEIESTQFQKALNDRKSQSAQPGVYLGDLSKIPLYITSLDEQAKIGEYFTQLDHLITLHQRKYDRLVVLKKSMLEKLFPKNGSKVPEIRFEGFTKDWEQRKLGEVVERVTRKNQDLVSDLPLTISARYGLIDQNEFFDKRVASKDVSGYFLVEKGEFAYNKSTSLDAPWGAVKRLDRYEKGVLSTLYIVFRILDEREVNSDYLVSYYDTDLWYKGISEIAAEGARNHGLLNITPVDFFNTKLMVPQDVEEQKRIGQYFEELDHLITLHQRKLENLQMIKKFMLQNMFI